MVQSDNDELLQIVRNGVHGTNADVEQIIDSLRKTYSGLPEDAQNTLGILIQTYARKLQDQNVGIPLTTQQRQILEVIGRDAASIGSSIVSFLGQFTPSKEGSLAIEEAQGLTYFANLISTTLRFGSPVLQNGQAQLIIANALSTAGNFADVISTRYFLGTEAESRANELLGEYFVGVGFKPSVAEMNRETGSPVEIILRDWYAAVRYCMAEGVSKDAFLRDGTPLFRFAPDCLPYVQANIERFPKLELLKVNDGQHVEQWLKHAAIGVMSGTTTHDNWLTLLTGYTPNDNKVISGLYERYNKPLISTAVAIGLNK